MHRQFDNLLDTRKNENNNNNKNLTENILFNEKETEHTNQTDTLPSSSLLLAKRISIAKLKEETAAPPPPPSTSNVVIEEVSDLKANLDNVLLFHFFVLLISV